MIKVFVHVNNRATLILGLSRNNTEHLHKDHPIAVDLQALLATNTTKVPQDIWIIAGETEEEMYAQLRRAMPNAFADAEAGGRVSIDPPTTDDGRPDWPDNPAQQRKGRNPFERQADDDIAATLETWAADQRQRETWRDGDTNTYRYRANLLEAAAARLHAPAPPVCPPTTDDGPRTTVLPHVCTVEASPASRDALVAAIEARCRIWSREGLVPVDEIRAVLTPAPPYRTSPATVQCGWCGEHVDPDTHHCHEDPS